MHTVVHSKTVFENVASCHRIIKGITHFKTNSLLPIFLFLEMMSFQCPKVVGFQTSLLQGCY